MRALVIVNGYLTDLEAVKALRQPGDLVVAADGGASHCERLGWQPDILIGDFDSIQPDLLARLAAAGTQVLSFPARKDYTDLELALRMLLERGLGEVILLGASGSRLDQSVANLLLLASPDIQELKVRIIDGRQEAFVVRPGKPAEITGAAGDTVSLIPLAREAEGVLTSGLEYPLRRETLRFGSTRGVSNTLLGSTAQISLEKGLLLCTIIHDPQVGSL